MEDRETRDQERIRDENEWMRPDPESDALARRSEDELKAVLPAGSVRVLLPSNADPLGPQDPARRARFAQLLAFLVESPGAETPGDADAPPGRHDALAAAVCTACRGSCCRSGGDHAYLTGETIVRAREAHPDWTPARLIESYLERLPAVSVAESCIYHSPSGCGLPRDLRSSTCNRHLCGKLKNLLAGLPETAPPPVLAVMFDGGKWTRTALIDEAGARILRGE